MGLLNLALGQFLGIFAVLAGLMVALYFYDRSRRRVQVSTLRFWPLRQAPPVRQRYKKIQQPLSLLLQLLALLLLLLAIADLRLETLGQPARQHVILLDTSAVMAQNDADGNSLIEQAKAMALAFMETVPRQDNVLLIGADAAPTVIAPFTSDRQRLRDKILEVQAGWTALDLGAAYELAAGTLRLALNATSQELNTRKDIGEIVYIGAGRTTEQIIHQSALPNLRFLETGSPSDTVGLLNLSAAAEPTEPSRWDITLEVHNYSNQSVTVDLEFFYDDRELGYRKLQLPALASKDLSFILRTTQPGSLRARTNLQDGFETNNEAIIKLPVRASTKLEILGNSQQSFASLLAAGARINPVFIDSPEQLSSNAIHVWSEGGTSSESRRAIYIAPPGTDSPFATRTQVSNQPIREWSAGHPLVQGIRDQDMVPRTARIFEPQAGDEIIASTSTGPVILARTESQRRLVAFGFDLTDKSVQNRLSVPMLFANAISWLEPQAFQPEMLEARTPGIVELEVGSASREQIRVRTDSDTAVPWLLSEEKIHFFAGERGTYHVTTPDQRLTLFLNQPQIAMQQWEPPPSISRGLPAMIPAGSMPWIPWPWLTIAAALLLLVDWLRFGKGRLADSEVMLDAEAATLTTVSFESEPMQRDLAS